MSHPYIAVERRAEVRRRWPPGQEWRQWANCAGQEHIYVAAEAELLHAGRPSLGPAEWAAKAICRVCPVIDACLADALITEKTPSAQRWSVRGGLNPVERERAARKEMLDG